MKSALVFKLKRTPGGWTALVSLPDERFAAAISARDRSLTAPRALAVLAERLGLPTPAAPTEGDAP